jgi:hypothetical protein
MHGSPLDLSATHMAPCTGLMRTQAVARRIPSFAQAASPAIVQASCLLASMAIAHLGHGLAGPGCFFVRAGVPQG